jgi:hypothetical protein
LSSVIPEYPIPTVCDYCGAQVIYTSNAEIYGREYGNGRCYKCTNCDAYVSVHDGTDIPKGRLADKELRELKQQCHVLFDPAWKKVKLPRRTAYQRLATLIGIPPGVCHFGWFGKDLLLKSLNILSDPLWFTRAG